MRTFIALTLITITTTLQARLGETRAQCDARYGTPTLDQNEHGDEIRIYHKWSAGIALQIHCVFEKGTRTVGAITYVSDQAFPQALQNQINTSNKAYSATKDPEVLIAHPSMILVRVNDRAVLYAGSHFDMLADHWRVASMTVMTKRMFNRLWAKELDKTQKAVDGLGL